MASENWAATPPPGWLPAPEAQPPEARKARGTVGWDIVLGLGLSIMGLLLVSNIILYLMTPGWGPLEAPPGTDSSAAWLNIAFLLFFFGIIPFAWVAGTRVVPWRGAIRYLHLDRPWPAIAHGLGYAMLLVGIVIILGYVLDALGLDLLGDPETDVRFQGMNWALVFATAAVAASAEEIFFRGVLLKWIGVWPQALIFGLFHLAAGPFAVLVTGLVGLLFGYLVKRGRSLWVVITAHFFYNLALLAGYMLLG